MRAAVVLVFSLAGIPISFFRPHLGILFFSIHAYLRPNDLAWGIISLRYSLYIAVATLIGYIFFEVRKRPVRLRPNLPLLLLWVYVMFSAVFAFNRELASAKLEEFSKIVLISILTSVLLYSEYRIKWLIWTIAISFRLLGLWGALRAIMTGGARLYGPGDASHLTDNNDFALALDMSLPLLFYLGVHAGRKLHRV